MLERQIESSEAIGLANIKDSENQAKSEYIRHSEKIVPAWMSKLDINDRGATKNTFNNFKLILENDLDFAGKIRLNEFAGRACFNGEFLDDTTMTKILLNIEKKYHINNRNYLEQVADVVASEHKFNPIKEYLDSLKWDGIPRVATALSDYFGCEHSEYNEYCFRVFIYGAISRALNPGIKFDYMLTLYGDQGQGKSTFFRYLCSKDEYYQDNLDDFEGKSAFEKTENKWIVEAAEMTYMSKSNIEKIKAYITARKDFVRYAYHKFTTTVYRKFVLIGTTNNPQFLSDKTGNRRFLVVNVKKVHEPKKNIFSDTIEEECSQIMAEAYKDYLEGKSFLVMPDRFNEEMIEMQEAHMVDDAKEGIINAYLEERMKILYEQNKETWGTQKYYCCIKQLAVEALRFRETDKISRADSNDIALIMQKNKKWIKCDRNGKRINTAKDNIYGVQKAYEYNYDEDEVIKKHKERLEKKKQETNENINKILGTENESYFMEVNKNANSN